MQWFYGLGPVSQAFLATCGTWLITALGASVVTGALIGQVGRGMQGRVI